MTWITQTLLSAELSIDCGGQSCLHSTPLEPRGHSYENIWLHVHIDRSILLKQNCTIMSLDSNLESNTFTILSFKFIIPATFNRIPKFNTGIKRIITTSKKNGKNYNKIQFTHPWEPVLQIPDCLVKTYEKSVRSTILSWQRITFTRTRSQLLSLTLFCKKRR